MNLSMSINILAADPARKIKKEYVRILLILEGKMNLIFGM